jgi:hypothetical protein
MRRFRFHFVVGFAFLVVGWLLYWLITSESSPISIYVHTHEWVGDYWLRFNLLPVFFATRVPLDYQILRTTLAVLLVSLWWFGLGFVVAALLTRFKMKRDDVAYHPKECK